MGRLEGKVALLAGSAKGMGRSGGLRMGEEGAAVVFADIDIQNAEKNAVQVRAAGGRAAAFAMDISSEEDTQRAAEFTVREFGRLDILHNNAAAFVPDVIGPDREGDILTIDVGVYDRTMEINLRGYMLMARAAVPRMLVNGGGSIIQTSSAAGITPEPVGQSYSISKAGVIMLSACIATAYGKRGIRCNTVIPGLTMTMPMEEKYVDILMRQTLTPEPGSPEDLANTFVFLASDEARFITGAVIHVDGGLLTHAPYVADLGDLAAAPSPSLAVAKAK